MGWAGWDRARLGRPDSSGDSSGHGVEVGEAGGGETVLVASAGALWERGQSTHASSQRLFLSGPTLVATESNLCGVWPEAENPGPVLHGRRGSFPCSESCSDRSSKSSQGLGSFLSFSKGRCQPPSFGSAPRRGSIASMFCAFAHQLAGESRPGPP